MKIPFLTLFPGEISLFSSKFYTYLGLTISVSALGTPALAIDSYRVDFSFTEPRKYAARFIEETRTLQIKVIPALPEEFEDSQYYDPRFIRRVILDSKPGEVIVNLQLKDISSLGWMVATQQEPWRIVVDIWKADGEAQPTLQEEWDWNPNELQSSTAQSRTNNASFGLAPTQLPVAEGTPKNRMTRRSAADLSKGNFAFQSSSQSTSFAVPLSGKFQLPDPYQRLYAPQKKQKKKIQNISPKDAANDFYQTGQDAAALAAYRQLDASGAQSVEDDPQVLWQAGESAFVTGEFPAASSYFRKIIELYPGSLFVNHAKLRLVDIDDLKERNENNLLDQDIVGLYKNLANDKNVPNIVRISSSLRLINKDFSLVKNYLPILSICIKDATVNFDLRKICAYDEVSYSIEFSKLSIAYAGINRLKNKYPKDPRNDLLKDRAKERIQELLTTVAKTQDWKSWTSFEDVSAPDLLSFTEKEPRLIFTRAQAFEAMGNNQKAISLYLKFLQQDNQDNLAKMQAQVSVALVAYDLNKKDQGINQLSALVKNKLLPAQNLGISTYKKLGTLSAKPYANKDALQILLQALGSGFYNEENLSTLLQWTDLAWNLSGADNLYTKLMQYPIQSPQEAASIEQAVMKYADVLRVQGRANQSAEAFFALASLPQGTRQAEAAYKAGIMYGRAGNMDKAKQAWEMAAASIQDEKYRDLARERLDRLK